MKALDRYLRTKQVAELTGLSRAMIYKLEADGSFPKKVALSVRAVGWLESEVVQWLESRKSVVKTGREAKPAQSKVPKEPKERPTEPTKARTPKKPLGLNSLTRKTTLKASSDGRRAGPTFEVKPVTAVKKKVGPSLDVVALAVSKKKQGGGKP